MGVIKNKPTGLQALNDLNYKIQRAKYPNVPYFQCKQYRDDTSNDLTRCVIDWIKLNSHQSERINSTGRQIYTGGQYKWIPGSSTRGTADISSIIKGRAVKIEIKCRATNDRYQSEEQKQYQYEVERAGGIYLIVRDFQEFYDWYLKFVENAR